MGMSRVLGRLWVSDSHIELSCLFIKVHVSPSDVVIPCLSRFWWNGRRWIWSMQRIIWSASLLSRGNSLNMCFNSCSGFLSLDPVRSCSVWLVLCCQCFFLPSITLFRQQRADTSPFLTEAASSSAVFFSPFHLIQVHLSLLSVAGTDGCITSGIWTSIKVRH